MRDDQMVKTRLCAFGMVIYEILRRRGIDTSSVEKIAAEFSARGFEKRVGGMPSRQRLWSWFNRGVQPAQNFGPFFCDEFVETNQEEAWVALTHLYPWRMPPDFPPGQ